MKRSMMMAGLAIGVVGAGIWARRRFAPALPPVIPFTPNQVPLLIPGRVAVERVASAGGPGPLPLVLVLHGVGADERQLGEHMPVDRAARFVFLRAPLAMERGFQWFPARLKGDPRAFMADVTRAAAEVLAVLDAIAAQRPIGKKILVGYSQGAHLAWSLAATGRFDHVVAAAGALPPIVRPPPRANVQIRAIHGRRDSVVPFAAGQATAKAFEAAGYPVKFSAQPFAAHGLSMIGPALGSAVRALLPTPTASFGGR